MNPKTEAILNVFFNPKWIRYRQELQSKHPEGDYYRRVPYVATNPIAIFTYIFLGILIGLIF